jgi:hypothetical protein
MGLLSCREEGGRKVYELTEEGKKELEEHRAEIDEAYERFEGSRPIFHTEDFHEFGKQVARMFKSLGKAFRKGFIGPQKMARIREVIEEAMGRIDEIVKGE